MFIRVFCCQYLLIIYLDNHQGYGAPERIPMKGVISGAGIPHLIAFHEPRDHPFKTLGHLICTLISENVGGS